MGLPESTRPACQRHASSRGARFPIRVNARGRRPETRNQRQESRIKNQEARGRRRASTFRPMTYEPVYPPGKLPPGILPPPPPDIRPIFRKILAVSTESAHLPSQAPVRISLPDMLRIPLICKEMDATAADDLKEFLATYRGAIFPNSEELFRDIEQNSFFTIMRYPGTQPCREIAQVYRERAIMAAPDSPYSDGDLHEEFSRIADALATSPEEPCRLWVFRGRTACFSAFEMEHSRRIAGCLRRDTASSTDTTQK